MIKAVIFDCDGLLIDTETPWYDALQGVFLEHQQDLPLALYVQCVGSSFAQFNPYDYLEELLKSPINRQELESKVKAKHEQIMLNQQLLPGVEEYLLSARNMGLKIALASSSSRAWVEGILKKNQILHYFDSIHTANDVQRVKPDPELYLQALNALGVKGEESIVFEDSNNGLKAAKAAGAYCVIIPNSVTQHLAFDPHDARLTSMAERSLDEVIQMVLGNKVR